MRIYAYVIYGYLIYYLFKHTGEETNADGSHIQAYKSLKASQRLNSIIENSNQQKNGNKKNNSKISKFSNNIQNDDDDDDDDDDELIEQALQDILDAECNSDIDDEEEEEEEDNEDEQGYILPGMLSNQNLLNVLQPINESTNKRVDNSVKNNNTTANKKKSSSASSTNTDTPPNFSRIGTKLSDICNNSELQLEFPLCWDFLKRVWKYKTEQRGMKRKRKDDVEPKVYQVTLRAGDMLVSLSRWCLYIMYLYIHIVFTCWVVS